MPPRAAPVENGKPVQGTWTTAFNEVDLLDIRKPFRSPFSNLNRNSRIKEWESFYVQNDRFILQASICNYKIYRYASVFLYDIENKKHFRFSKIIPLTGWRLPRTLKNTFVDSRSWGFFFRIHNWLDADTIKLDLDIEPTRTRPSFTAHFEFSLDSAKTTPMAVSLVFNEDRSMYAYKALTPVRGDMVLGGQHISLDPGKTNGLFCDFKGYYPYPMHSQWCTSSGFDSLNRRIGFTLNDNQNRESYKNNENALWIDGRLTPLPPVKITQTVDEDPEWIIQDMEGMVDLVFTPKEHIKQKLDRFLFHSIYESPLGFYNGMMVSSDGEEIPLRNMCGTGEKLFLRI